jgi:hypothetical protein
MEPLASGRRALRCVAPLMGVFLCASTGRALAAEAWPKIAPYFQPAAEFKGQLGSYRSPLQFADGRSARTPEDWVKRRAEILAQWHRLMGPWLPLLDKPQLVFREQARRENFLQHKVTVPIAPGQTVPGYLLVPEGKGPFPAVLVPFYDAETSAGLNEKQHRDFGRLLAKRGFVVLCIGSPGGDALKPDPGQPSWQPLSFLAYVAANCHTTLAQLPFVDAARIGVVGHSYGGKWAMFASCLYDKFAAAAWSDPGIVFEESRGSINYWEPWYLGRAEKTVRKPGRVTPANPRTGAYKVMMEQGRDLHELHALMAPRPFLVSGGAEDPPKRWLVLNHALAANAVLGQTNRVMMTNRKEHGPNEESNELLCLFFEHFLKPEPVAAR